MTSIGQQLTEDRTKALRAAGVADEEIPSILDDLAQMDQDHWCDMMEAQVNFQEDREHMRRKWMQGVSREMQRAIEDYQRNHKVTIRETHDNS
ncbi:MAG: hypothetical protein ACYTBJ_14845 [Planctomycetota bacterium]|jgi:hypothetical protein